MSGLEGLLSYVQFSLGANFAEPPKYLNLNPKKVRRVVKKNLNPKPEALNYDPGAGWSPSHVKSAALLHFCTRKSFLAGRGVKMQMLTQGLGSKA